MDRLGGMTLFMQVCEAGSFVAAGRQLGVSASAVGKSVRRLEEKLGVSLFRRSTRSISLTEEGEMLLERCRRIFSELEAIELELSSRKTLPRGKLRITMPLVSQLLLPAFGRFSEAFPEIELDLDFNDRIVDLVNDGFDAAIRTGQLTDSRLMSRHLGKFRMMLVASPAYIEKHGMPAGATDLAGHSCLHHKWPHSGKLELWPIDGPQVQIPTTIVANNIEALMFFARDSRGISCLPDFAVRDDVISGRLVHVLPGEVGRDDVFRILWPSGKHTAPRIRALVDFLVPYMASSIFLERKETALTRVS